MNATDAGARITRLREELRLSQADLADRAGLSRGYINQLEQGKRKKIRKHTLARIADALEWPDWDTMMASEEVSPPPAVDKERPPVRIDNGHAVDRMEIAKQLMALIHSLMGEDDAIPKLMVTGRERPQAGFLTVS